MLQQANKNGISLTILVITIIIIIILAGAVIVALNNSGVITKAKIAKESSEFTSIREAVELEKQNMLLTGTFDKNKIDIPNKYEDDIEVTATGEILIKYNAATKIIDIANAIKILGASYIPNGFDEIQSISGGTASAGETKLAKIIIEGKSEQTTTTQGKNLFDKGKIVNNILTDDGRTVVNVDEATKLLTIPYSGFLPNSQYTMSFYSRRVATYGILTASFYYTDGTNSRGVRVDGVDGYTLKTITSDPGKTIDYIKITNGSNWDDDGYIDINTIQLELGTVATAYAPFVPNSPSPDYSSTINSVSNFNLVSSGKNVLQLMDTSPVTKNGVTYWTENGVLHINGTVTVSFGVDFIFSAPELKSNTIYTVSQNNISLTGALGDWFIFNSDNVQMGRTGGMQARSITTPTNSKIGRVQYWFNPVTFNNVTTALQIEQGPTATHYESFGGMNTINFPNITLRSLPDGTKDYIEIDNVNKTVKLYKNIGEYIFTGSESWNTIGQSNEYTRGYTHSLQDMVSSESARCTHLNVASWVGNYDGERLFYYPSWKNFGMQLSISRVPEATSASIASYFTTQYNAGTPVTVQYKLATPTVTNLTYQELQIGYPLTNIYTTSIIKPKIIGQVINK